MTVSLNYLPWVAGLRAESQNHHHQFHAALVNRSSRLYRTPPHSTNLLKKTEAFVSFKLFLTFTAQRKLRDANKLLQLLSLQREAVTLRKQQLPAFRQHHRAERHPASPSCPAGNWPAAASPFLKFPSKSYQSKRNTCLLCCSKGRTALPRSTAWRADRSVCSHCFCRSAVLESVCCVSTCSLGLHLGSVDWKTSLITKKDCTDVIFFPHLLSQLWLPSAEFNEMFYTFFFPPPQKIKKELNAFQITWLLSEKKSIITPA